MTGLRIMVASSTTTTRLSAKHSPKYVSRDTGGGDPARGVVDQAQLTHAQLQILTALLQGLRDLPEHVKDGLEPPGVALVEPLEDRLRGRGADRARQRSLGELQELGPVGLREPRAVGLTARGEESFEGRLCALATHELGDQCFQPVEGELVRADRGCRARGRRAAERPHETLRLRRFQR